LHRLNEDLERHARFQIGVIIISALERRWLAFVSAIRARALAKASACRPILAGWAVTFAGFAPTLFLRPVAKAASGFVIETATGWLGYEGLFCVGS
jgi:hypothetical protein